ncbi:MAG TPA: hypothetical protein VKI44_31715 [Acetobacteraceae bacterium]|nr:hypothetical protein [Acetobacteraceae bacterium]
MAKHALSELTLDAATEIDRSLAGLEFDPEPVQTLGKTLGKTLMESSEPLPQAAQIKLVEPDYFQPLERLFRDQRDVSAQGVEEILSFVKEAAQSLMKFKGAAPNKGCAEQLRGFCLALHEQLVDELAREDGVGVPEWSPDDRRVQTGVRKTQVARVPKGNRRVAHVGIPSS